VFLVSAGLGALGTLLLLMIEWDGALGGFSPLLKFWNALFHSLTPRTAGFNTLPMGGFSSAALAVTALLMVVGASPASTGGGIKTTTFGILLAVSWSNLRGEEDVILWKRRVPYRIVSRALTLFFPYLTTLFLGSLVLTLAGEPFMDGVFEAASALGTVGLSLGITPDLSVSGKIVLVLLMFWGRVGLLTFMYSLLLDRTAKGRVSYPDTDIPVG
jgi:trk system potassium uptake protein TrkH